MGEGTEPLLVAENGGGRGGGGKRFIWTQLGLGLLLVVLATLVYLPSWPAQYTWDDDRYVLNNQTLRQGWSGLKAIWLDPNLTPDYYPLAISTLWVDYQCWGLWSVGYRVVNTMIHIGGALFLWQCLRWLKLRQAYLAALIFAVHPIQVESIAWISERKNVLCGLLFFAALYVYLRFVGLDEVSAPGEKLTVSARKRWGIYAGALLLFVGAMFSKTTACVLPVVILILLWYRYGRITWKQVKPVLPLFVIGLALSVLTITLEHGRTGTSGPEWEFTFGQRTIIAGRALWFYVGKLVNPSHLLLIYPRWWGMAAPDQMQIPWYDWLYPIGVWAVIIGAWVLRSKIGRGPLAGMLCFCVIVGPALGFISFYTMLYSFVADHYQYMASAAMIALLVETGGWLWGRGYRWLVAHAGATGGMGGEGRKQPSMILRACPGLLVVGVVFCLSWLGFWQSRLYVNQYDLWRYAYDYNPENFAVRLNYAASLIRSGKREEGIAQYEYIIQKLKPMDYRAYMSLSIVYMHAGNYERAVEYLMQCEKLKPVQVLVNEQRRLGASTNVPLSVLGQRLRQQGDVRFVENDFKGAEKLYRQALSHDPKRSEIWYRLSMTLHQLGREDDAKQAVQQAITLDPTGQETIKSFLGNEP